MSVWNNIKDSFIISAMHSPLGGGGLARAYYRAKGYSNDQINNAIDAQTKELEARHKGEHGFAHGATSLLGSILGGVDPTYAVGGGGTGVVSRAARMAAVQAPGSVVRQATEIGTGQRKHFDPKEVVNDMAAGAAFEGGTAAAGKLARLAKPYVKKAVHAVDEAVHGKYAPIAPDGMPGNASVPPIDPKHLSQIMNDPAAIADHGAKVVDFPARRINGRDRVPGQTISEADLADLPPANRQYLDATAEKPVVDNTGYEAHTPYIDEPAAVANDVTDQAPVEQVPPKYFHSDELTPMENQDFDAAAPKPDIPDTYGEVPYEAPPAAVNDAEPLEGNTPGQSPLTSEGKVHGPFEEHPTDDPDGNKYLTYTTKAGDKLPIKMGIEPDGTAEIAIDQFGNGTNKLGPAEIREAMYHLQDMYPEIKKFGGYRRSGAGKGRVQEVAVPERPVEAEAPATEGKPSIWSDERGSVKVPSFLLKKKKNPRVKDIPDDDLTPEQRVIKGMDVSEPILRAQDAARRIERSKRFEAAQNTKHVNSGEAGFHQELSQLSGDLPQLPSPYSIRPKLEQGEVDNLFNQVRDHPSLSYTDSIHARTGLQKLLQNSGAELPTHSELAALRKVFSEDPQPGKKSVSSWIADVINAPRSIMASMDLSAPLRQGLPMIHRKEYWTAFGSMFKQIGQKGFDAVKENIASRPSYHMMKDAGLALTDVDADMSHHEERFLSNLATQIPIFGHVVKGSERAYVGFLNKLRADTFDTLIKNARDAGHPLDDKAVRDIAEYINTATGRGDLNGLVPKFLRGEEFDANKASPLLSGMLFSPRLMASRFQMLNPYYYYKLSPIARKEAAKSLASTIAFTTTSLGLAHMAGVKVGVDPRSTDFGKIRVGHTTYDMTGGFSSYIRLIAQEAYGQRVNPDGSKKQINRLDTVGSFLRNKESPPLSEVHSMMKGVDNNFEKIDLRHPKQIAEDIGKDFVPLVAQDTYGVYDDASDHGKHIDKGIAKAIASAAPDLFGIGVNTYVPKEKASRKGKFDDKMGGNFSSGFGKGGF